MRKILTDTAFTQAVIGIAEVVVLRALLLRRLTGASAAAAQDGGFAQPGFGPAMALATCSTTARLWLMNR